MNNEDIKIRKLESEDELNKIMDIWLESNLDSHKFIDESYWISNFNNVKLLIPKADVFFIYKNNNILGFTGVMDNYIAGIFIDKKYRNEGLGTLLINKLKTNYNLLILDVYKENINAYNFYMKKNFSVIDEKIDTLNNQVEYTMIWKKE